MTQGLRGRALQSEERGIKGGGEAGTNAVGAAIASAIDDAIGVPGAVTELPVTPQRLVSLMKKGKHAEK